MTTIDLHEQANSLRIWGCVVIVGAGVSRSLGFPLASDLHALVWHALDADFQARNALASSLNVSLAPAKQLVGNDEDLLRVGLEVIAENPEARRAYQYGFASLNQERAKQPSPAHDFLAQLLHRGTAEFVVSMNWDTLLEVAYLRRYGIHLNPSGPLLFKPHGNAAFPDEKWILPHEAGRIPPLIEERVRELTAERPRVLLSIGYSGRDEVVVEKLTRPLSERWQVIRVSPNASSDLDIPQPAESGIPNLVAATHPNNELPGWEYVRFDHQHDLSDALLGRRLGPANVKSCPKLPQVAEAGRLLKVSNSVVIAAQAGLGKSITAYQSAYDLWLEGREVLQPADPQVLSVEMVDMLEQLRLPSVVVVDDAHLADQRPLRRLINASSSTLAVILAATPTNAERIGEVRINGPESVQTLAREIKKRRSETLQILRKLNVRVGDGSLDVPVERYIGNAASNSDTPWQFMHVLTEGWRRARSDITALRYKNRSDLLVGAIAAGQFLTLDAGVTEPWLYEAAALYDRDNSWVTDCLQNLERERLIFGENRWRCLHINFAEVVLRILCEHPDPSTRARTLKMVRESILRPKVSLSGVEWLLFRVWYMSTFRWNHTVASNIVDDHVLHTLTRRCWTATSPQEVRDAAYLLRTLLRWHSNTIHILAEKSEQIGIWLTNADATSATGLGWLLNDISNEDRKLAGGICESATPETVAKSVAQSKSTEMAAWGFLLGRFVVATDSIWHDRLVQSLNRSAILELPQSMTLNDLYGFDEFWECLLPLDATLMLEFVLKAIPAVSRLINSNPTEAISRLHSLFFFFPIHSRVLDRRPGLPRHLRHVYRQLARAIDPNAIVSALQSERPRDWHYVSELIRSHNFADPYSAREIAKRLNFDELDRATSGQWQSMPPDLHELIVALDMSDDHEPARSWTLRHASDLDRPTVDLARIIPETCVELVRSGKMFSLGTATGSHWDKATEALYRLREIDPGAAQEVLGSNYIEIAKGLVNPRGEYDESLAKLLNLIGEMSSDALVGTVRLTDPAELESRLTVLLRGKRRERQIAARIIQAALTLSSPHAEVATHLRRRFPKSSVVFSSSD